MEGPRPQPGALIRQESSGKKTRKLDPQFLERGASRHKAGQERLDRKKSGRVSGCAVRIAMLLLGSQPSLYGG